MATQLIAYLPLTIMKLYISDANFENEFMEAVIKHVSTTSNLKELILYDTKVCGEEGGKRRMCGW